jgi:xanthosine utilization system XapX-like protein/plasmid stabilization system protein ParE
MKRFLLALGAGLTVSAAGALAQSPPPPVCNVIGTNPLTQTEADVTISCSAMPEGLAWPLTAVLTRILQQRLDPQQVPAKLTEVAALPVEGAARTINDDQRQAIVRSIHGKPSAEVAMIAHPPVEDTAEFAQGLATPFRERPYIVPYRVRGDTVRIITILDSAQRWPDRCR